MFSVNTHFFSINEFTYGVAHRGASIRIPRTVEKDGYGYLEVFSLTFKFVYLWVTLRYFHSL